MDQVAAVAAAVFPSMMQGDRPGSMPLLTEGDNAPPKNCFRLVVLGSAKVGKTAVVTRFLHNKFTDNYTPTIEDFHRKIYRIRGEPYRLDILDTSGNDPFPAMRRLSLLTGDLFILVYSIDNRESFEEVKRLQEQVWESKQGRPGITKEKALPGLSKDKKKKPLVPMVIVGNKSDKESDREVGTDELIALAEGAPGCGFVESSAKKNVNIEEIFFKLFELGKLPTEMSPSMHRKVQPSYVPGRDSKDEKANGGSSSGGSSPSGSFRKGVSIRRRLSDACGAVAPNARRPSIRTDLLILQTQRSLHGGSLDETGRDRDNRCSVQ